MIFTNPTARAFYDRENRRGRRMVAFKIAIALIFLFAWLWFVRE